MKTPILIFECIPLYPIFHVFYNIKISTKYLKTVPLWQKHICLKLVNAYMFILMLAYSITFCNNIKFTLRKPFICCIHRNPDSDQREGSCSFHYILNLIFCWKLFSASVDYHLFKYDAEIFCSKIYTQNIFSKILFILF